MLRVKEVPTDFENPFSSVFESEIYLFFTICLILIIIFSLLVLNYQLKKLGRKFMEIFALGSGF